MRLFLSILILAVVAGCNTPEVDYSWSNLYGQSDREESIRIFRHSSDPDCEVLLSEYCQTIDGFGYTLTSREANMLSHMPSEEQLALIHALHGTDGAEGDIIQLAVKANGYESYIEGKIDGRAAALTLHSAIAADSLSFAPFVSRVVAITGKKLIWAMPDRPPAYLRRHHTERETMSLYADYFYMLSLNMLDAGVRIKLTSPQNDLSTPRLPFVNEASVSRFIGRYLGSLMEDIDVGICLGSVSSASYNIDAVLSDTVARKHVTAVSFCDTVDCRWIADKCYGYGIKSIIAVQDRTAEKGSFKTWDRIRRMIREGATGYVFSGLCDTTEIPSTLINLDHYGNVSYNSDYYLFKQISQDISPGALRIRTSGRFSDLLAFLNRDNSLAIVAVNRSDKPKRIVVNVNDYSLKPLLPAESISTFLIKGENGFTQ